MILTSNPAAKKIIYTAKKLTILPDRVSCQHAKEKKKLKKCERSYKKLCACVYIYIYSCVYLSVHRKRARK